MLVRVMPVDCWFEEGKQMIHDLTTETDNTLSLQSPLGGSDMFPGALQNCAPDMALLKECEILIPL